MSGASGKDWVSMTQKYGANLLPKGAQILRSVR
jgi:hypothetical protein